MVLPWSWNSLDSLEEFRQAANLCERIHWIFPLLRWNTSEEAPRNLADVSPRTHDCSARLQPGNSSKLFHLIRMMKLLLQIVFWKPTTQHCMQSLGLAVRWVVDDLCARFSQFTSTLKDLLWLAVGSRKIPMIDILARDVHAAYLNRNATHPSLVDYGYK